MARKIDPAKREAILTSARELFKNKGVENTKMAEIAAGAGIATGTIYLYFKSKMDIVDALCNHYLLDNIRATQLPPDMPADKVIEYVIHAALVHARNNADLVRLVDLRRSFTGMAPRPEADKVVQKEIRSWLRKYTAEGAAIPYNTVVLAELLGGVVEWVTKICFVWADVDPQRYEDTLVKLLNQALLKNPR